MGGSLLRGKTLTELVWVRPIVLRSGEANGGEEGKAGREEFKCTALKSQERDYLVTKKEYSAKEVQ